VLQGCRNEAGLWTVPLKDEAQISQSLDMAEAALNVYDAARNGNLITFPGLTIKNINKHFPESEETQKGHMRQSRQGVRSSVFDATKKPMYSDQTGLFPIKSQHIKKSTNVGRPLV